MMKKKAPTRTSQLLVAQAKAFLKRMRTAPLSPEERDALQMLSEGQQSAADAIGHVRLAILGLIEPASWQVTLQGRKVLEMSLPQAPTLH